MNQIVPTLSIILALMTFQLGDNYHKRRDAAYKALSALVPLSLPFLQMGAKSNDLETASRSKKVINKWMAGNSYKIAVFVAGDWKRLPWYSEFGEYQYGYCYVKRSAELDISNEGPDWLAWRYATLLWMIDSIEAGASLSSICARIEEMRTTEINWKKRNCLQPMRWKSAPT